MVLDSEKDESDIFYSEVVGNTNSLAKANISLSKSSKVTFDGMMHEELKDNKIVFSTPIK